MSDARARGDASRGAGRVRPAAPAHVPAQPWMPSVNPWIIAVSVMLATFMEVLDTSVANVALPHISGNLSATTDESTWVLTSYLVSNAIILPATNWLARYFGRKRFLITCIVIFTLASALCGAATSLSMLIFARVLQGAGGGALQPIAQSVLLESFPPEKRGQAMAVFGLGIVVAPIIGPTLGGWITDNYSWRWIFYINIPIGALAIFMANTFVEDPPYIRDQRPGRIDYVGFGLMAVGLATLQLVLDKGQEEDWFSSSLITWAVVFSVVALVAFIIWELRSDEPIVNLRILKNRNFAVGTMLITLMGVVLYGSIALLPLFLQTLLGYPATASGMAVSPRGFGSILSMLVVGRLVGRVDGRYLIMFGFTVLAFSTYMLAGLNLDIAMSNVVWPNIISGCAMGFIFVPLTTMAMGTLPNEQMGNASGVYNLMRNTGGSIGIAAMSTLLSRGAQVHQAAISAHLTPYDPAFQQRMQQMNGAAGALGGGTASPQALASVYGTVLRQSMVLSFLDNFRLLAFLCLLCIPAALLFKRVRAKGGPVAAH
ncbi:MAG TPA: DHA2 family efflux MFS transporter permease subunit [Pyrinomonadaceae bacterium]|jgi:DHA2 family multidrug resistance protein|nr:DHA2 family efflux MFS transporter permease subunit [Pyrinomonadaceae bacterium]